MTRRLVAVLAAAALAITMVVFANMHVTASRPPLGSTAGPIPTFSSKPHPRPVIAVIGDSYAAGTETDAVWPAFLARKLGYRLADVAIPGGGYNAPDSFAYATAIDDVVASDPAVIIVSGGRNDSERADGVGAAASELLTALQEKAPKARLVVIGPIWDLSTKPAGVYAVNAAVRGASESRGIVFHDVLDADWVNDPGDYLEDGVHPNGEGHKLIAERTADLLKKDGVDRYSPAE